MHTLRNLSSASEFFSILFYRYCFTTGARFEFGYWITLRAGLFTTFLCLSCCINMVGSGYNCYVITEIRHARR